MKEPIQLCGADRRRFPFQSSASRLSSCRNLVFRGEKLGTIGLKSIPYTLRWTLDSRCPSYPLINADPPALVPGFLVIRYGPQAEPPAWKIPCWDALLTNSSLNLAESHLLYFAVQASQSGWNPDLIMTI